MQCPRLDHFVRFNFDGTVSRCGHMTNAPKFQTLEEMEGSSWLVNIKEQFANNIWPSECIRCQEVEEIAGTSIRLNSIKLDHSKTRNDYLQVAGILDNVCNSACQFCNPEYSTKIGAMTSPRYVIYDNAEKFWNLPLDRIEHLDINGGEPSASKNYKKILQNLPVNLKTLRVNTNCSILIPELEEIQRRGIDVTITVSFDGVGPVHDYVRWPIQWDKFVKNLLTYKTYNVSSINLWTTINALNVNDLENIFLFAEQHQFDHSYAFLKSPMALSAEFTNSYTLAAKQKFETSENSKLQQLSKILATGDNNQELLDMFIDQQDQLREIKILDFIKNV